jgi:lipoprotein-anchoring transpeptidase ErfK/SrfK
MMPAMAVADATGRERRRVGALVAVLAAAVALGGCGGGRAPDAAAPATTAAAPVPTVPARPASRPVKLGDAPAYAALAATDVTVRSKPGGGDVTGLFTATLPWGSPTPFLVRGSRRDASGATWLKVLLPRKPNGSTGWVRGDQVRLTARQRRAEVDLSDRILRLYAGDRLEQAFAVAVGSPNTPTPTGQFFVTVHLHPPQISTVYGSWALGLSAYSQVYDQFGTGDGQIALHGWNNLADLGRAVSHGCVRLDNQAITRLAGELPIGSPVTIRP